MSYKDKYEFLNEKDFEDEHKSAKFLSVLEIIIVVLLALIIVFMLGVFVLFSKEGSTPELFGYKIFISKATTINDIGKNAAIFARDDDLNNLKNGNVVLCRIGEENITTMLRVQEVVEENGEKFYILRPDTNPENATIKLPHEDIIGKAVKQDQTLGNIITFARSKTGIITIVIVPFLIFFVLQIIHIIRLGKMNRAYDDEDEDDDEIDEDDEILFSTLNENNEVEAERPQISQRPAQKIIPSLTEPIVPSLTEPIRPQTKSEHSKSVYPEPVRNEPPAHSPFPETFRKKSVPDDIMFKPQNNIYVDADGKAELPQKPKPTATIDDLRNSAPSQRNYQPSKVVKPVSEELNNSGYYKPADIVPPKSEQQQQPAAPQVPDVSDITVPDKAVQPDVTIAPPPKSRNNKTLEELMMMIDKNIK